MNLQLRSIIGDGILANERITLRALRDLDVGDFLLAQTAIIDDSPSTKLMNPIWFPFGKIKKGDLVVVYTKEGETQSRKLSKGNTAHFYYLDLDTPIWTDPNIGAVVMTTPSWTSMSFDELRSKS